jgi:hypothetical protein
VVPTPTGALQNIARSEERGKFNLGEATNRGGTFFSGMHLRDIGRLADQAAFQRQDALNAYKSAESKLNTALAQAQAERDAAINEAYGTELEEFQKTPVPVAASKPSPGKKPPKKKPGGKKGKK